MTSRFREFLPSHSINDQRYPGFDMDAGAYADMRLTDAFNEAMFSGWNANADDPFCGISCDGSPDPGLFELADDGAPVDAMLSAARAMLALADPEQQHSMRQSIDAIAWRKWSNPEIYANRHGIRLDEISPALRGAILQVVQSSLSADGYQKARDCMYVNGFIGRLMWMPQIMNEFSYNFTLFGEPSRTAPWGWQLNGHHLVMNCLVVGRQMVISPCFWAAEPNEVDEGPRKGLKMFVEEETGGYEFMRALAPASFAKALLHCGPGEAIPKGRRHLADNFHLAGAGQDNRVIPYEGVAGSELDGNLRKRLLDLVEVYHRHLPSGPKQARMTAIENHLDATRFCWIGGTGHDDPFYYRIQSPVTLIEFDHHAGVFLKNDHPEKFHIHTLMRTPNGNDYGMALVRRQCEAAASKPETLKD